MKLRRPKPCICCGKKRYKGYWGAVLAQEVVQARKKLKIKGREITMNEFVCCSCELLIPCLKDRKKGMKKTNKKMKKQLLKLVTK